MGGRGSKSASSKSSAVTVPASVAVSALGGVIGPKISTIEYREVYDLPKELSSDEIITKLGGPDRTAGSCASLALAYAANRCGFDVIDYRGGASQAFFSYKSHTWQSMLKAGLDVREEQHTSDIQACKKLFNTMQDGEEYILSTGQHAAVVKKESGALKYLELQSNAKNNGWESLDTATLRSRFGAKMSHSFYGTKYKTSSYLTRVSQFKGDDTFKSVMGYINTAENQQKKGLGGGIK